MVGVTSPFSHHLRLFVHAIPVEDSDNAPVAAIASASHIDHHQISVVVVALCRVSPNLQFAHFRRHEMHIAERPVAPIIFGIYLTHGDRVVAVLPQCRHIVMVKHRPLGGVERLLGSGGVFRHHCFVATIFTTFGIIPSNLLQRQPDVPQPLLILIHIETQPLWVGDRHHVDVALIPGDKHGSLVAQPSGSAQPLVVEEITRTVGSALQRHEGVALQGYRAGDRADDVDGVVLRRGAPESHLREVSHCQVFASCRGTCLGGGDGDGVWTVGESQGVAASLKGFQPHLRHVVGKKLLRVFRQDFSHHAADGESRLLEMGANDAVPIGAVHKLNPRHISLHKSAATHLSCFEENNAYWFVCRALSLHLGEDEPLGAVEAEFDVAISAFIFDGDTGGTPILEVVVLAEHCEVMGRE